jgi:hypothetical protein
MWNVVWFLVGIFVGIVARPEVLHIWNMLVN